MVDCEVCGYCCKSNQLFDFWVKISDEETLYYKNKYPESLIVNSGKTYIKTIMCDNLWLCYFLNVSGISNRCRIYEERPIVCRNFTHGCRQCRLLSSRTLNFAKDTSLVSD